MGNDNEDLDFNETLPGAPMMVQEDARYNLDDDEDYSERTLRSNIQFSDKIITPGTNPILLTLLKKFGIDPDTKEADIEKSNRDKIEQYKLMFQVITRDYNLSNLDVPKTRSSWEFSTFVHSFMEALLAGGYLEQALVLDAILLGELNLTRGIGFKQQEALHSYRIQKDFSYPAAGVKGQFGVKQKQ